MRRLIVGAATLLAVLLAFDCHAAATDGAAEKAVFQRLFAPCCYRETLDMHVSPISEELRLEIRARLGRGEAADAIVADMARRYGEEVLVRPPGRALTLAIFCGAGALAGLLVGLALWHSRRAANPTSHSGARPPLADDDPRLSDALEDELAALE